MMTGSPLFEGRRRALMGLPHRILDSLPEVAAVEELHEGDHVAADAAVATIEDPLPNVDAEAISPAANRTRAASVDPPEQPDASRLNDELNRRLAGALNQIRRKGQGAAYRPASRVLMAHAANTRRASSIDRTIAGALSKTISESADAPPKLALANLDRAGDFPGAIEATPMRK